MTCITQRSMSAESSESDEYPNHDQPLTDDRSVKKKAKCKIHQHKKIEAFCETCKQILCIECILKQDHKSHEMISLEAGAQN